MEIIDLFGAIKWAGAALIGLGGDLVYGSDLTIRCRVMLSYRWWESWYEEGEIIIARE